MGARLHVLSDLHAEFGPFPVSETDADVVDLAGDIGLGRGGGDPWIHGHTHPCVDCAVGHTRVVSNQRGYLDEVLPGFRPDLVVTVG